MKTRAAKRTDNPVQSAGNPIISKLLDLKYRINDAYRNGGSDFTNIGDKKWVMGKIEYLRYGDGNVNKLTKEDMVRCNEIWSVSTVF